jgi:hypothetical protein
MSESVEEDFQSFCMSQRFQTPLEKARRSGAHHTLFASICVKKQDEVCTLNNVQG